MQGQARKSLWIETLIAVICRRLIKGQARKSLWIETLARSVHLIPRAWVRLVRACGSKRSIQPRQLRAGWGQARKSLWIETACLADGYLSGHTGVRLVRACGSKLFLVPVNP